jgi:HD domain
MKSNSGVQKSSLILDFWGKASAKNEAENNTHSIAYHSMDVAAVGRPD